MILSKLVAMFGIISFLLSLLLSLLVSPFLLSFLILYPLLSFFIPSSFLSRIVLCFVSFPSFFYFACGSSFCPFCLSSRFAFILFFFGAQRPPFFSVVVFSILKPLFTFFRFPGGPFLEHIEVELVPVCYFFFEKLDQMFLSLKEK